MDRRRELLTRVFIVMIAFAIVAVMLISKATYIHVVEGKILRKKSKDLYYTVETVEAERGRILAVDGSPLATSQPIFEIRMDTRAKGLSKTVFERKLDSLANQMHVFLYPEKNLADIKQALKLSYKKGSRYVLIGRNLNYEQMLVVKQFPILNLGPNAGGLIIKSETKRIKPYQHLASRTIGIQREHAELVGLEKSFNQVLEGKVGHRVSRKAGPNLYLPVSGLEEILPQKGKDIKTTVDVGIQEVVELALEDCIRTNLAESGCAIVMEVETGAIKAIANLGWTKDGELVEDYNYAIAKSTEPGSTMKLASLLALLTVSQVDTSTLVDLQGGSCAFYDRVMYDSKIHGQRIKNLAYSFIQSSNVGISKLVAEQFSKKPQQFVDFLRRLGLDKKTGIELEGEPEPVLKDPVKNKEIWYGTSLPWMSVGYELQLTPMQLLCFYNTIANDGKRVKPRLVSAIMDGHKTIKSFKPEVEDIPSLPIDKLEIAKALMQEVVDRGTAKNIKSERYDISGKTGTAVTNYFHKDAATKSYQASFAGFFPSKNPVYSCIVVIYNPQQDLFYGGDVAAPVFKRIADRCMRAEFYKSAALNINPKVTLTNERLPLGNKGAAEDFDKLFRYIGLPFEKHVTGTWIETNMNANAIGAVQSSIEDNVMPDLSGMGLRDACFLMDAYGGKLFPKGSGKIIYQNIPPGTIIKHPMVEVVLD